MMGLISETELRNSGETLQYCPIEDQDAALSFDTETGILTAQCTNGVQDISTDTMVAAWTATGNELARGQTLRVAVVALYPTQSAVPSSKAAYSDEEKWLANYFSSMLPPVFAKATLNRAAARFTVEAADVKGSSASDGADDDEKDGVHAALAERGRLLLTGLVLSAVSACLL